MGSDLHSTLQQGWLDGTAQLGWGQNPTREEASRDEKPIRFPLRGMSGSCKRHKVAAGFGQP